MSYQSLFVSLQLMFKRHAESCSSYIQQLLMYICIDKKTINCKEDESSFGELIMLLWLPLLGTEIFQESELHMNFIIVMLLLS